MKPQTTPLSQKRLKLPNPRINNNKRQRNDPKPLQESFNKDELHCVICMDYPTSLEIYQCTNSHLLCSSCHQRILENDNCVCPTCRVKLSRDNPCRSRLAEIILSKLVVNCPNPKCGLKIYHGELEKHQKEQCKFRITKCKFFLIGCDWKGIAREKRIHEKHCTLKKETARKILKRVIKRNNQQETTEKRRLLLLEREKRVCSFLTSRSHDIAIRDIILFKDDQFHDSIMASPTFRMFDLAWEILIERNPKMVKNKETEKDKQTETQVNRRSDPPPIITEGSNSSTKQQKEEDKKEEHNNVNINNEKNKKVVEEENNELGLRLKCHSILNHKLRSEICVLSGPQLGFKMKPTFFKFVYKQNCRSGEFFPLHLTNTQFQDLSSRDSANFRIIVCNKNDGLNRSFSTNRNANSINGDVSDSILTTEISLTEDSYDSSIEENEEDFDEDYNSDEDDYDSLND